MNTPEPFLPPTGAVTDEGHGNALDVCFDGYNPDGRLLLKFLLRNNYESHGVIGRVVNDEGSDLVNKFSHVPNRDRDEMRVFFSFL